MISIFGIHILTNRELEYRTRAWAYAGYKVGREHEGARALNLSQNVIDNQVVPTTWYKHRANDILRNE